MIKCDININIRMQTMLTEGNVWAGVVLQTKYAAECTLQYDNKIEIQQQMYIIHSYEL